MQSLRHRVVLIHRKTNTVIMTEIETNVIEEIKPGNYPTTGAMGSNFPVRLFQARKY